MKAFSRHPNGNVDMSEGSKKGSNKRYIFGDCWYVQGY